MKLKSLLRTVLTQVNQPLEHWERYRVPAPMADVKMEYTTLGRTGLRVSVMGLGSGGYSRLGLQKWRRWAPHKIRSERHACDIIQRAVGYGINIIDTAQSYRTEPVIARAIQRIPRDTIHLSTKALLFDQGSWLTETGVQQVIDRSLQNLNTDYIDIFNIHGVPLKHYAYVVEDVVPELLAARDAGKIRFLGITELFSHDTRHTMLKRAIADDCWDTVMVGFNVLNQSARTQIFPTTQAKAIGVLSMFAVRRALCHPRALAKVLTQLQQTDPAAVSEALTEMIHEDPGLTVLWREGDAANLPDAAYRFCRHDPGTDVVLFGTGDYAHLDANVASLLKPPLPDPVLERLQTLLGHLTNLSGN